MKKQRRYIVCILLVFNGFVIIEAKRSLKRIRKRKYYPIYKYKSNKSFITNKLRLFKITKNKEDFYG